MREFEAINVVVERKNEEYKITGVDSDSRVETFRAGALNINGMAFAASSMEIGEYGHRIIIEQESGSRYLNLRTEEAN